MALRLDIDFKNADAASAREKEDARRKLQIIVDAAVAPRTDLEVRVLTDKVRAVLDGIASEQRLACFRAAVNAAGLPEAPFNASTVRYYDSDTTDDLSGSEQREYSV